MALELDELASISLVFSAFFVGVQLNPPQRFAVRRLSVRSED